MGTWHVIDGRVEDALPGLDASSFDAVLCDPPYGLEFMSAAWDKGVPPATVWREVLRALRPGAMLLAAGGTRTYHRLACAIEDAGFELRDCVGYAWVYATGFPKSLDLSKAIDDAAGAKRDVVGARDTYRDGYDRTETETWRVVEGGRPMRNGLTPITAPATPEAATWSGYGTALAPAWEPYVLGMKPTDGTFVANALRHGVAGLNIDGGRIGTSKDVPASPRRAAHGSFLGTLSNADGTTTGFDPNVGRWPKNLVLDEGAGALLDAQAGTRKSGTRKGLGYHGAKGDGGPAIEGSTGGASRFFYCPKASTKERQAGMAQGEANAHPTLKPIALCRYLATMLLPPAMGRPRRLLVPFSGAGSEMIGALLAGWDEVVGVEMSHDFARVARARLEHWTKGDAAPAQAALPGVG